jgi:hypothetical protein
MATIGNFTVNGNGFVGTVKTLALGTVKAKIVPAERTSDKAPDYRIFAGTIEFGAGWKKKSQTISRSSWTTRASRLRSTPRWSRWKARKATRSSGLARTATETPRSRPRRAAGPSRMGGKENDHVQGLERAQSWQALLHRVAPLP